MIQRYEIDEEEGVLELADDAVTEEKYEMTQVVNFGYGATGR